MPQTKITKADVARCLRAARAEGFTRVEIDLVNGKIVIISQGKSIEQAAADEWFTKYYARKVDGHTQGS